MERNPASMAQRFRDLLAEPDTIAMPGVYDVFSAMMSERAGFKVVFASGYGIAASLLGNPDIGLTTLVETAQMARNIVSALGVPTVVDVDNGYGNAENVARTIREMEAAGVAAVQMEDQILPKRCGHADGKQVLPMDLYLRKLEAALRARTTPMALIARTDALDLDEGIRRAAAYQAAGADCTIVDGLRSIECAQKFVSAVPGPKMINLIQGGKTPILSIPELQKLGFKLVLYSTPCLYMVAKLLKDVLPALYKSNDLKSIESMSVGFKEFQTFIEESFYERMRISPKT